MADYKQDLYYSFAYEIINGNGGGEYMYSLQEDYIYSYENGVWKQIFDIEFLDRVESAIPEITKFPLPAKKQIIENFKHKKYIRLESWNKNTLINFENYMFDPLGMNVLTHKSDYLSTIRIPYKYDALAKCDLWIKTLLEIFEGNTKKIDLLQEFFGYCLSPDNEQKKGFLLLGETDTGKSTIIDTFRDVMGEVNISNVPLQYLAHPQYTPLLINKSVNLDPDVNKNATDYEREFKIITGGKSEKVSCNQKHIPTFEFTPKCKLILAANIFPKITDHSSAFYQRLLVVPCERRFQEHEKDRLLNDKLREELPGIFNWMVEGLHKLKKRGRFEQHEFMLKAVEELENENNPSSLFFDEHIEITVGSFMEKGDLYKKYKQWSDDTKNYALSENRFSNALYKKFSFNTPKNARLEGGGKRIWRNLKYVHFKDDTRQNVSFEPAVAVDTKLQSDINWEK